MTDGEQVVETALLILNQEVNKLHGVRKVRVGNTFAMASDRMCSSISSSQNIFFVGSVCAFKSSEY